MSSDAMDVTSHELFIESLCGLVDSLISNIEYRHTVCELKPFKSNQAKIEYLWSDV